MVLPYRAAVDAIVGPARPPFDPLEDVAGRISALALDADDPAVVEYDEERQRDLMDDEDDRYRKAMEDEQLARLEDGGAA